MHSQLLSAFLIAAVSLPGTGSCIPIESFDSPHDVTCVASRGCSDGFQSPDSIGASWGYELEGGEQGKARVYVEVDDRRGSNRFGVRSGGRSWSKIVLTWDGDLSARQLSSAGLGCVDLTTGGATALVLHTLWFGGECEREGECELRVEARMYDSRDPTGQRYSRSEIRRRLGIEQRDLYIPFSAFTGEGPNGPGDPSCVGALRLFLIPHFTMGASFSLRGISTNGAVRAGEGVEPSPTSTVHTSLPDTPIPQTPSATVMSVLEPGATLTAVPSLTPLGSTPEQEERLMKGQKATPPASPTALPTASPTIPSITTPVPVAATLSPYVGEVSSSSPQSEPTPTEPVKVDTDVVETPGPTTVVYGEVYARPSGKRRR